MMNQHPNQFSDDDFERMLSARLQQAQPYLMDDDFTANVMAKLPAPKKLSRLQECLIVAVPAFIIGFLILSQMSLFATAIKLWAWLMLVNVSTLFEVGLLLSLCSSAGVAFWVAKQHRLF